MSYDYIIVGGGPAGCVAAYRLVTDHGAKVLVLEEGRSDRNPLMRIPGGLMMVIMGGKDMKFHVTEPVAHLDGQPSIIGQGNVLGGGTSVNAMLFMRGRPSDYAEWAEITQDPMWDWDHIFPYMRRTEGNADLSGIHHGTDGPMKATRPGYVCDTSRAFLETLEGDGRSSK